MGRLTDQKKAFLDAWFEHGDVAKAAKAAKYSQPGNGYKVLRQDANGMYIDNSVRQYLAHLSGLAETPVKKPVIEKHSVKPISNLVMFPNVSEDDAFIPTVEDVLRLLWALAQDTTMSSGARVTAASNLLKDLRGEPVEVEVSPEELVDDLKQVLGVG
jgi:hypothetical protein